MKRSLRKLSFITAFFAFSFISLANDGYPRYRYVIQPLARMHEVPSHSHSIFASDMVSMHFQIEVAPGSVETYWLLNVSFEEYQNYMKQKAPALEGAVADKVKEIIAAIKRNPYVSEEGISLALELNPLIGLVRTQYILESAPFFPLEALNAMAGVKSHTKAEEPFLTVRRFGVMRRRGPRIHSTSFSGARIPLQQLLQPLVRDPYAHLVVGDIITPFTPHYVPTPVQFYPEIHMSEFFEPDHKSLLIAWGLGSEETHNLSYKAYQAQMRKGRRESIDEKLLATLKEAANSLDLSRLFFYVIEDFVNETALETISFIDGGSSKEDFYETPAEKRFAKLNIRQRFSSDEEIIEIHGLAIDPNLKGEKESPINTEAWCAQIIDFIQNGSHERTRFILQADPVPARLYGSQMGFHLIEESKGYFEKDIFLMHTTGAELKEKIYKLFPHLKIGVAPEVPNRLNRRTAGPESDAACFKKLRDFGHI